MGLVWLSPQRQDFDGVSSQQVIPVEIQPGSRRTGLRMLRKVIKNKNNLRELQSKVDLVLTFGETNLPSALMVSWLVHAPLSVGVRANVPRRQKENRKGLGPFKRFRQYGKDLLMHQFLRFAYSKAKQIVVQTPQARQDFCENYSISPDRIDVLANDIPPKFKEGPTRGELPDRPRRLLFIGNDSRIKGFDVLAQALNHLENTPGSLREATIVGVKPRVYEWSGNCNISVNFIHRSDDVRHLMCSHDLLVVPSREDQFPNVVLEAFALGLPVIGSNVDGIAYMLDDPFLLFPPDDVDGITDTLFKVSTPEGYVRAQRDCQTRSERFDFDWEAEYLSLLEKLIKK